MAGFPCIFAADVSKNATRGKWRCHAAPRDSHASSTPCRCQHVVDQSLKKVLQQIADQARVSTCVSDGEGVPRQDRRVVVSRIASKAGLLADASDWPSSNPTSTGTWKKEENDTRHVYIRPRTPDLNGKVERSHRVDEQEFYQLLDKDGITDDIRLFNDKLRECEDYYNYHRPHGGLKGQTPYERLLAKKHPARVLPKS
jgi:transposase InsO family protein